MKGKYVLVCECSIMYGESWVTWERFSVSMPVCLWSSAVSCSPSLVFWAGCPGCWWWIYSSKPGRLNPSFLSWGSANDLYDCKARHSSHAAGHPTPVSTQDKTLRCKKVLRWGTEKNNVLAWTTLQLFLLPPQQMKSLKDNFRILQPRPYFPKFLCQRDKWTHIFFNWTNIHRTQSSR